MSRRKSPVPDWITVEQYLGATDTKLLGDYFAKFKREHREDVVRITFEVDARRRGLVAPKRST